MRRAALVALLVCGCGLSVVGIDDGTSVLDGGSSSGSSSSGAALVDASPTVVDASTNEASVIPDATTNPQKDADAPKCDATACPGRRCVDDQCSFYADCKGLHDGVKDRPSGVYMFRRPDGSATFNAYCEMDFDSGGWTLVGQSQPGVNDGTFGWGSKLGDVNQADKIYSLDALEQKLAINEVLAVSGTRASFKIAYRVKPPADFPNGRETSATAVQGRVKLANNVCPAGGDQGTDGDAPEMLGFMGWTSNTDAFFFRDINGDEVFGLRRDGWQLNFTDDCKRTGRMHKTQGLLFVR